MTHTQGPWRTGDRFNTVFGPPNGNPAPKIIATVNRGNEANARLIGAAPELLEACKAIQVWSFSLPLCYREADEWKAIDAAIAKAEGKQ